MQRDQQDHGSVKSNKSNMSDQSAALGADTKPQPSDDSLAMAVLPNQGVPDPLNNDIERFKEERPVDHDANLIDWQGPDDPQQPQNWSLARKVFVTGTAASCSYVVSFGSSVISPAIEVLGKQYRVSSTVATLTIALYVLGFAAGPLTWAPLGDVFGHHRPVIVGFVGFMCFTIGAATAQNLYTIMICRFMQGAWGVVTVNLSPGMIVAMWSARVRPLAILAWGATVVFGPTMGPVVGGFTTENSSLGWRWTMWLTLILSSPCLIALLFVPETFGPLLLQRKAQRLRYETKNWALHAPRDEQPLELKHLLQTYGLRPVQMLFQEPILAAITMYNALIYAIIYMAFEAYPYSFGELRGWELGVSTLPFLSMTVGAGLSAAAMGLWYSHVYAKKTRRGQTLTPEDQLPQMIVAGVFFIIGLFWFGWTSYPSISWVPQVLASSFIGGGFFAIFTACQMYIVECYLVNANSAIAANAILRSAIAGGFPLFALPMYRKLGVPWASSLLGFLSIALVPFPVIFYVYGKKIRSWSRYTF